MKRVYNGGLYTAEILFVVRIILFYILYYILGYVELSLKMARYLI